MGVATMLRGTPLFLPLALLPVSLYERAVRSSVLLLVAMAILVAPWCIRNLVVLDDFIPVAVGAGWVLLQGSDERFFTGDGKATYYASTFQAAAEAGIQKSATDHESQVDQWIGRVGLWVQRKRFRERPLSVVPLVAHKLARVWYGTESGGFRQRVILGFCALLAMPAGAWQLWKWRTSHAGISYLHERLGVHRADGGNHPPRSALYTSDISEADLRSNTRCHLTMEAARGVGWCFSQRRKRNGVEVTPLVDLASFWALDF